MYIFQVLALWMCCFLAFSAQAITVAVEGDVSEDGYSLELSIDVSSLTPESLGPREGLEERLLQGGYLNIYLPGGDARPILRGLGDTRNQGEGASTSTVYDKFYWEPLDSQVVVNVMDTGEYQLTYALKVLENENISTPKTLMSLMESLDTHQGIKVEATFGFLDDKGVMSNSTKSPSTYVEQIFSGPLGAPGHLTLSKIHRGIGITWDVTTEKYTVASLAPRIPRQVLIMVFDKGAGDQALKGMSLDDVAGNDEPTTCLFSPEKTPPITCDGQNSYVSSSQDSSSSSPSFPKFILTKNSGSYALSDLDSREYSIVLQYPKGMRTTDSLSMEPTEDRTFSELSGAASGIQGDPRCFIASAAFGSPVHGFLEPLRWGRDHVLKELPGGNHFLSFYYEKSPPWAFWISQHPSVAWIVRFLLFPWILLFGIWSFLGLKLGIFMLGISSIFVLLGLLKRKKIS